MSAHPFRRAVGIVLELLLIGGSMVGAGYLAQRAIADGLTKPPVDAPRFSPAPGTPTP